jgi:hypothetical protein
VVALSVCASTGGWKLFAFVAGGLIGIVVRDFGWVRAMQQAWPSYAKVIDRDAVERLTEEKPSPQGYDPELQ